ncbi:MAG: hypothetical protein FWD73_10350 [Polyangiaceae bacterium]|nr:hypothetical protein [Polyangiaceae bacterium]
MSKVSASKKTRTSTAAKSASKHERRKREREERAARNRRVNRIHAQERDEAPVWRPFDNTSGVEPLGHLVTLALSSGEDGDFAFATGALETISDDLNALHLALLADGGLSAIADDLSLMLWRLSKRARCASELAWRKRRARMNYDSVACGA